MRCVSVTGEGVLVATGDTTCSGSQFVLLTQSELDMYTASPFKLSVADGAALSSAIVSVWVTALVARYLIRVLGAGTDTGDSST